MSTSKQRREAERRRLQRQVQRRADRDARRRRITLIVSAVLTVALLVIVIGFVAASGTEHSNTAANSPSATTPAPTTSAASSTPTAAPTYPCSWTAGGTASKKVSVPSSTTPPKTGDVTVHVQTTDGPMTLTLDRSGAPCTVASFVSLVEQHYYDHTPCHRLVTSGIYVLQCGDPTGTGTGGPGYSIPDEATGNETYPAGTIAMARTAAAHSGGSQFFIVYKDSPSLQQNLGVLQYTVFGKVTSGLSVVARVAAGGATGGSDGAPKLPITLTKATVAG
jgi:peptidyl-prolyl cis-trans isomerase B (cyclophilin B)